MGTLSCLANTLPPRVSSLLRRQLACCWFDGALPGMAHYCSTWPSSLCQGPRKEQGPSRRASMPRMCSQTQREAGHPAREKRCWICPEASSPSCPLFLLHPPTSLPRTLSSSATWSWGAWNSTQIPKERPLLQGGQGPAPLPPWDALTGSGSHCSVLNTNCSDQFPGTLVESQFPSNPQDFPQILKGLQWSWLLVFTKPTSFWKQGFLEETRWSRISMQLAECTLWFCFLDESGMAGWSPAGQEGRRGRAAPRSPGRVARFRAIKIQDTRFHLNFR